jgi:hypothetical protein
VGKLLFRRLDGLLRAWCRANDDRSLATSEQFVIPRNVVEKADPVVRQSPAFPFVPAKTNILWDVLE